jgi:uncharacterized protein (TIGR01777 family)
MNILIAGGSGLIGKALINALQNEHYITVVGRDKRKLQPLVTPKISYITWDELPDLNARTIDCIINLCGYNIADSRWSQRVKQQLITSRVETTARLIHWAIQNQAKPHFICANAVGIYGIQNPTDTRAFDENTPWNTTAPTDFLHEIGMRWQAAVQPAEDYGMPVTITRFGVVIKKNQGMLGKLQLSFAMGLGCIIGNGQQILSWIALDDVVDALQFLIHHPELTGAFNLTSPHPISQAEFARALAHRMHRPLWLTLPAVLVRMLFGEMGECLLLSGQRVLPKRLLAAGYTFHYPTIQDALAHEL